MEVVGGDGGKGSVEMRPFLRHALVGEFVGFCSVAYAVHLQLHRGAVSVADQWIDRPCREIKIQMGDEVENRLVLHPLGAVEMVAVLFEAAGIQHACAAALVGPEAFAQIVYARPHEAADDKGAGANVLPQLF